MTSCHGCKDYRTNGQYVTCFLGYRIILVFGLPYRAKERPNSAVLTGGVIECEDREANAP